MSEPKSANEPILQNMLGEENVLREPKSRIEVLLQQILQQMQESSGGGESTYVAEFSDDMTNALLSAASTAAQDILSNSKNTPVMATFEYVNDDDLMVLHETGQAFEDGKRCLLQLTLGGKSMLLTATHAEATESAGLVDAMLPVYPQIIGNSVYYFTVGAFVTKATVSGVNKVSVNLWLQLLGTP